MALTSSGQIILSITAVCGIASYVLAKRLVRRKFGDETQTTGHSGAIGFWALVAFSLLTLSTSLGWMLAQQVHTVASYPSQSAQVVSYTKEASTCERKDSSGRTRTYSCTMYAPVLQITPPNGPPLTLPSDVRSSQPPTLGETMRVIYVPGAERLIELSLRSTALYAAGAVMLLIMVYFLYLMHRYGAGHDIGRAVTLGIKAAAWVLAPIAFMLLHAAFVWVLYGYFFLGNPDDLPTWAAVLLVFFTLCLLPVTLYYLRTWIRFLLGQRSK